MSQISNHQSPISNRTATPFLMPMFRDWVPKRIQPWIYIAQVICIQFSCGVYLGAMEAVRGTTALQLEDLLMLLYAGLAGMAVWFPMLFRTKFRFTNQQLLITSAVVIAVCNLITMRTTNMAILLPVCFLRLISWNSNSLVFLLPIRDYALLSIIDNDDTDHDIFARDVMVRLAWLRNGITWTGIYCGHKVFAGIKERMDKNEYWK